METQEYTLSITFELGEGTELPDDFLVNVEDPDELAMALASLARCNELAEQILKISGTVYGPKPSYIP